MAAGAYAKNLSNGDCLVKPLNLDGTTRNCIPFRELCVHTYLSSPANALGGNGYEDGLYGCGKAYDFSQQGTKIIPPWNLSDTSSRPYGINYGKTRNPITFEASDGSPVFFDSIEFYPWMKRAVAPQRRWYAQGPSMNSTHLVKEIRRRNKGYSGLNNNNYQGRYDYYFTDSDNPQDNGIDWMGPVHPAGYFWTNKGLNEPFLAERFFEQTGAFPAYRDMSGSIVFATHSQGILPFCDPMNVRNEVGTLIGQYIGLTCIHYFSSSFIHQPVQTQDPCREPLVFLPNDYYQTTPNANGTFNKVAPTNQFIQLETSWFMVGVNKVGHAGSGLPDLWSPKIASIRHWFNNKPTQPRGNPCDEYIYLSFGFFQEDWRFDANFRIIDYIGNNQWNRGQDQNISINMSGYQSYVTP